jgi:glycosyltransferase involved in cell wall biosynthesis
VSKRLSYAVITPARDEERDLPRLADALRAQTQPPDAWVVVDDGSSDGTAAFVTELARSEPWARLVSRAAESADALAAGRRAGRALDGFRAGVEALPGPVDVVVKIDADVDFDPDHLEQLMSRFAADATLGIASGTCYEAEDGVWVRRTKATTTVWGAARAYRTECLSAVMSLESRMGWDGLDELAVHLRGMRTATFVDLPFRHHRPEGGRERSPLHHGEALGRASWYMGYRPSYLLLRACYRARRQPSALAMVWGYAAAAAGREPRCPDPALVRALRDRQRLRVAFRRGAPAS